MIAGEGLIGILLAVLAVFSLDSLVDISGFLNMPSWLSTALALVVFATIVFAVLKASLLKKETKI